MAERFISYFVAGIYLCLFVCAGLEADHVRVVIYVCMVRYDPFSLEGSSGFLEVEDR